MKPLIFRRLALICATLSALALTSCAPSGDNSGANVADISASASDSNAVATTSNVAEANAADAADSNVSHANDTDSNASGSNGAATNATTNSAVAAATASPTSAVNFAYVETIYVPGKDAKLHAQKVSRMAIDSQLKSGGNGAPALQEILEKAPNYFPPGAKINDWKTDARGVVVDLNKAFDAPGFWSKKGEGMTELAVFALVNSAAKTTGSGGPTKPRPVRFTIEKRPALSLGEMDMDGVLDPNMDLVSK